MQTEKSLATKDNIYRALSMLRIELTEKILSELIPVMNEIHEVNYSYRSWKIMIVEYISSVISKKDMYEEKLIDRKPDLDIINGFDFPTFRQKATKRLINTIKYLKTLDSKKQIHALLHEKNNIALGFPDMEEIGQELGVTLPVHYPVFLRAGNSAKRKKVNSIAERYDDIFWKNIIIQLPQIYVEHFDRIYHDIPLINPAQKTLHIHNLYSLYHMVLLMKYIEHGAKLYWYQHGAVYGEFIGHNAHFHEASVSDKFRTWGWKIKENDEPWKAYRLEYFKRQYALENQEKRYDCLMCYSILYSGNIEYYTTMTNYILENLDMQKFKRILARPRPKNKLHSQESQLDFIQDKRVDKDSGLSNMSKAMAKCRLIIQFSVPSTNFLECLSVNHPTVGLIINDQPTDIVRPFYDFFLDYGVLHLDYTSMVKHLNQVDIESWWQGLQEEKMYQDFKRLFLNTAEPTSTLVN